MSERRIDRVPINDAGNGWNRILPQRTPRKVLVGEHKFDWLVIGAGLAAARRVGIVEGEARGLAEAKI